MSATFHELNTLHDGLIQFEELFERLIGMTHLLKNCVTSPVSVTFSKRTITSEMVKRYKRTYHNKDKYSVEQTLFRTQPTSEWTTIEATETTIENYQTQLLIVPAGSIQGMRKVKHITFSIANAPTSTTESSQTLTYAIVYVPAGTLALNLNIPPAGNSRNLYDANQFIMSSGVLDMSAGPCRIHSRLSRNLNSDDEIRIILSSDTQSTAYFQGMVSYAVTLQ